MKKIRWKVFLPPWLLLVIILILNLTNYNSFLTVIDFCTEWIMDYFTGGFCLLTFLCVCVIAVTYFSPAGKIRIGGEKAVPIVTYKNYVWIVLCTIMAAGIMFWACAEPMYHFYEPPYGEGGSAEALTLAMNTMFLEWSFTPMCIYGLPAILFAFVFYNMRLPFSIGSMLVPSLGEKRAKKLMPVIDGVCLFALCAGMAASLGQGVLLLSGGVENYSGGAVKSGTLLWLISTVLIVVIFVIAAVTGITRGIQKLSNINSVLYLILGILMILSGPAVFLINFGLESIGNYLGSFFEISLYTGAVQNSEWVQSWPGFYWCNWLAWMPVTAVFLGKISRGYTIRQIIRTVVVIPALFSMVWIILFSGTAVYEELQNGSVYSAVLAHGTEAATYTVLESLPFARIIILLFLAVLMLSFVTAADSNTNAMSSLCTEGLTPDDSDSPSVLKILWGFTIGAVCFIMLASYGVDGIKKLSNLGGFPDAFLMAGFMISWIKIMRHPDKYNKFKK